MRLHGYLRHRNENSHDSGLPMTTMNGTALDVHTATPTPLPPNGVGVNGNDHSQDIGSTGTLKFSTGLILPPPDVKCVFFINPLIPLNLPGLSHRLLSYRRSHNHTHEPLVGSAPVRGKTAREPAYGPRVLVPQPGRPLSCLLQKPAGGSNEGGDLGRDSRGCRR